ncbi:inositol monophosphatase [Oceanobacillus caeni]|uniref:inositol monophosphatase family protein n=1 Tax=Bacillaceae TaxID=186817 RepID=UPI001443CDF8|nr:MULTISPECIES: inositol monophosphatase family protein [Bacillaceae]MBU8789377.1 inositol monophosphatase [Oceanobacillus caeni]MCR1832839.1 inositol monophosphatase [Oceanobacillus caeni]
MDSLNIAIKIARKAGKQLAEQINEPFNIEQKQSEFDLVTEWDKKTEILITKKIKEKFPEHKVIGEESIYANSNEKFLEIVNNEEFVWVLDPIDGTNNFIHGLPGYSISIALLSFGEIILGVVYNPDNDEMFYAERGKGAYMNGERMNVSNRKVLAESILATGFPSDVEKNRKTVLNQIFKLGSECRNIRVYGSAALHCAYVAAGRLEAFWEPGLNIWDIAAGSLIVKEANGTVSEMDGTNFSLNFKTFLCSNGKLDNELIGYLN